jgi:23S rRNA (cytosine1962-C5)-methyltransferase
VIVSGLQSFTNRLRKNARHWSRWARRRDIACYRVYDRDIPEFPLAIDLYEDRAHVQEFARKGVEGHPEEWWRPVLATVAEVLEIPGEQVFSKQRRRQKGRGQYTPTGRRGEDFIVHEGGLRFLVNLEAYLDTGLFLDHRITRGMIRDRAKGKRFLNLFAYTGSFSVYAAAGGAASTLTVDLSNTYLDWAGRNLRLNGFRQRRHRLLRADVFQFLQASAAEGERFDLIVLDPPSFSNSKAMRGTLDVQRDQARLVNACLALLAPGGELFFSNNRQGFRLREDEFDPCRVEEITRLTLPEDFRRKGAHRCWLIEKQGDSGG